MIIIKQNTSRLDAQIDRLQQQVVEKARTTPRSQENDQLQSLSEQKINGIQSAAWLLPKASRDIPPPAKLADLISELSSRLSKPDDASSLDTSTTYQLDLVWLITAKAAVRTLGLVLDNLVEGTHILDDEILYWDDILISPWYIGFHIIQTSPLRMWNGATDFLGSSNFSIRDRQVTSITDGWAPFYDLIRQCTNVQSISSVQSRMLSHFALRKSEIRQRQKVLKATRDVYASSIGLLMKDCLSFDFDCDNPQSSNGYLSNGNQWREALVKDIILIEAVLNNTANIGGVAEFERRVSTTAQGDEHIFKQQLDEKTTVPEYPSMLHERLIHILRDLVPKHMETSRTVARENGQPSCLVRYWLPVSMLFFSASTSFRVVASKRVEILQWIMNIGSTAIDFWSNWVVDPIQRLIGTIRHDRASDIALMSKNSLEADRASLERMVVDFVQDRPVSTPESTSLDAQTITASVKEGDLTPVLKAYERDLRSPFVGTVRGDLIRALLIQIQKTKVDVEVAISGIDSLLRSQELVFGFVGLTPGILVSYSVFQWIGGLFGSRRGLRRSKEQYQLRHALRNVDRTLATSTASANGIITYKSHGLLICESEVLLQKAKAVLKGADFRKFSEDIGDLIDARLGVDRQLQVVRRIGWMYSRWFQP